MHSTRVRPFMSQRSRESSLQCNSYPAYKAENYTIIFIAHKGFLTTDHCHLELWSMISFLIFSNRNLYTASTNYPDSTDDYKQKLFLNVTMNCDIDFRSYCPHPLTCSVAIISCVFRKQLTRNKRVICNL